MCVLSHVSHVQLLVTLLTVATWTPLTMGFSRQEYWSGFTYLAPGNLPNPGTELMSPAPPALQADSLPTEPPGKHITYLLVYPNKENK